MCRNRNRVSANTEVSIRRNGTIGSIPIVLRWVRFRTRVPVSHFHSKPCFDDPRRFRTFYDEFIHTYTPNETPSVSSLLRVCYCGDPFRRYIVQRTRELVHRRLTREGCLLSLELRRSRVNCNEFSTSTYAGVLNPRRVRLPLPLADFPARPCKYNQQYTAVSKRQARPRSFTEFCRAPTW